MGRAARPSSRSAIRSICGYLGRHVRLTCRSLAAARALKKAGYKITLSEVERFRKLLEAYRPDLLPRPTSTTHPPSAGNGNVVRFKKPNGTGNPKPNGDDGGPSAA
jgi:hypothetical protein